MPRKLKLIPCSTVISFNVVGIGSLSPKTVEGEKLIELRPFMKSQLTGLKSIDRCPLFQTAFEIPPCTSKNVKAVFNDSHFGLVQLFMFLVV